MAVRRIPTGCSQEAWSTEYCSLVCQLADQALDECGWTNFASEILISDILLHEDKGLAIRSQSC